MSKGKEQKKERLIKTIEKAALIYKEKMVGRHFLYVFDDRYIEVVFRERDFMHLTGVDSTLRAEQFYKDAVRGRLKADHIFFSKRHPYDLCAKKASQLLNIGKVVDSELFILEDTTTRTFTYKFGLTDLELTICLSEDTDRDGNLVGDHYIARSLRVEDCFDRSEDVFTVRFIFARAHGERKYSTVMYQEPDDSILRLPKEVLELIDNKLPCL
ncbi:MAG: PBECR4 domain-containing protein [Oscillospiraceae bacterium]|nr:PBECR4 domain-containing protein [Oscillospiraceae bacterium]